MIWYFLYNVKQYASNEPSTTAVTFVLLEMRLKECFGAQIPKMGDWAPNPHNFENFEFFWFRYIL